MKLKMPVEVSEYSDVKAEKNVNKIINEVNIGMKIIYIY